jgi:hypothetical protein
MLDRIGFFPSRPICRQEGKDRTDAPEPAQDRADADLLRRTAARLRDDPTVPGAPV